MVTLMPKAKAKKSNKKEKNREEKPTELEQKKEPEPEPKTKGDSIKIDNKLLIILVAFIAVGFLYIVMTQNPDKTPQSPGNNAVQKGDTVYLKFIQKYENGTIIGTNYEDIAKKEGIIKDKYPPLIFIVGKGQVPKGLENAVIGMKISDKKTITLEPKNAYGEYQKELVALGDRIQYQDRNITAQITEHLTSEAFKAAFGNAAAILGDKVSTDITPWNYTITGIKDNNITVRAIITKGQSYKLPETLWNSTAIEVKDNEATFRQNPPDGFIVSTELGNATVTATGDKIKITINPKIGDISVLNGIPARVTQINETHITYDANQPLAGKTIIFEIELIQKSKPGEIENITQKTSK